MLAIVHRLKVQGRHVYPKSALALADRPLAKLRGDLAASPIGVVDFNQSSPNSPLARRDSSPPAEFRRSTSWRIPYTRSFRSFPAGAQNRPGL